MFYFEDSLLHFALFFESVGLMFLQFFVFFIVGKEVELLGCRAAVLCVVKQILGQYVECGYGDAAYKEARDYNSVEQLQGGIDDMRGR